MQTSEQNPTKLVVNKQAGGSSQDFVGDLFALSSLPPISFSQFYTFLCLFPLPPPAPLPPPLQFWSYAHLLIAWLREWLVLAPTYCRSPSFLCRKAAAATAAAPEAFVSGSSSSSSSWRKKLVPSEVVRTAL